MSLLNQTEKPVVDLVRLVSVAELLGLDPWTLGGIRAALPMGQDPESLTPLHALPPKHRSLSR